MLSAVGDALRIHDLAILLGAWNSADADLNADGATDAADLAILLGAWGNCDEDPTD